MTGAPQESIDSMVSGPMTNFQILTIVKTRQVEPSLCVRMTGPYFNFETQLSPGRMESNKVIQAEVRHHSGAVILQMRSPTRSIDIVRELARGPNSQT